MSPDSERKMAEFYGIQTPATIMAKVFRRGPVTDTTIKKYVTDLLAKYGSKYTGEQAHLMAMDVEGGDCPMCGKPWKIVPVENRFGKFRYFRPSCRCYGVCSRCGASLHHAAVTGTAPQCDSCGYDPRRPERARKKKAEQPKERAAAIQEALDD